MKSIDAQAALNQMIARSKDKPEVFFPTETEVAALKSCAEMLKAIPEPKPEFFVGWKGKTRDGREAEIFAIKKGRIFGRVSYGGYSWDSMGKATIPLPDLDLIPNTPPEPEIWYRRDIGDGEWAKKLTDEEEMLSWLEDWPNGVFQKVSVQAIP